ncbi:MAG: glycine cleavage T C-terminal barrel domain-containing protein [Anaerolineales bacterium]
MPLETLPRVHTDDTTQIARAYRRAREAHLWVRHAPPGRLEVTGADHQDFMHRMSTQELLDQPEWTIRSSVLTTPIAKVVDWIQVVRRPGGAWLLTSPGQAGVVKDWLTGYVFFRDDVRLRLLEDEVDFLGVYGPGAGHAAAELEPGLPPLEVGHASPIGGGLAWKVAAPAAGGVRILASGLSARLASSDAESPAARGAYQALRVEAGVPEYGAEVQPDSNPLDIGLDESVSFAKGCYIGQEIIARMESRGVRARRLVGLRFEDEAHAPQPLFLEKAEVGDVTTAAWSPDRGWIGLGIVRTSALEDPDIRLTVGPSGPPARVTTLPMA